MSTMTRSRAGVVMIILGLLAYFITQYGTWHYRDQATKRADSYIMEHLRDYHGGDFLRAFDGYLEETRIQRICLYVVHFGGFILACWGGSRLRQKPHTTSDD